MKTFIILAGLLILPFYFATAQVDQTDNSKESKKSVYLVIHHLECYDCQGTGYINKVTYNFKRNHLGAHELHQENNNVDLQICSIVCPYCGGKGKIDVREYKDKL